MFYAPLAYGSTTKNTLFGLDLLLFAGALTALVPKLLRREPVRIPPVPLFALLILAVIASIHVINARFEVNPVTQDFIPTRGHLPFLPSALDRSSALSASLDLLALGVAFPVLIDLAQHREERWKLLSLLATSGMVFALYGIYGKAQGLPTLPFSSDHRGFIFSTFFYHGNAAAFLNLAWPAALVLLARSVRTGQHVGRLIWANAFLFTFGALFLNASKFGHAAAIPGLLLAALLIWRCMGIDWKPSPVTAAVIAVVLLAGGLILMLPTMTLSMGRWEYLISQGSQERMLAHQAALRMIPDAPLWGIGPGCFRWGFPFYTAQLGERIKGVWIHAHQDYIQTLVEWGIVGGTAWMILIGGGLCRGWSKLLRGAKELSTVAAVMGLTLTAVHALLDFPFQIGSLRYASAVYLAMLWSPGGRDKHKQKTAERSCRSAVKGKGSGSNPPKGE